MITLHIGPDNSRPLIAEVVAQTVAALEVNRAKLNGRIAFSEAEAAHLFGVGAVATFETSGYAGWIEALGNGAPNTVASGRRCIVPADTLRSLSLEPERLARLVAVRFRSLPNSGLPAELAPLAASRS